MLSANCEGQIMGMIFQTRSSKANAESWENERNSHLRAIKTWHIRVGKRYLLIETNTFLFVTLTYHQFFTDLALIYLNPNEVMRLTAIFTEKNLKFFVALT